MDNLFRSNRLLYRAVEDTQEDQDFLHQIQDDIDAFANSSTGVLRPETHKNSKEHADFVANKTLIGVIICLAPPPPKEDPQNDNNDATEATAKPTPIGSLYLTALKADQIQHRHAYISIDIVRAHQKKGYGSEAINWMLDWGFKQAGLHHIGIDAFSYNQGATQLYERRGFVFEGRKRELLWYNGGWHDWISYSLLVDEWRELRRQGKGANDFAV